MNQPPPQPNPADQGGPIAGPAASTMPTASPLGRGRPRPTRSGNSGAPQGTTTPPAPSPDRRLSATAIDRINDHLSDRDRAILRSVADHQFLTARHIETLHFDAIAPDARSRITRRVLARLRGLRVLGTLDRRIGGVRAGSQGLIHHVGVAGDRLIDRRGRRSGRLRYEPSARFLAHRLAVADLHVALSAAERAQSLAVVDSAVEPATWRSFTGPGAARRTLKPDLYVETADSVESAETVTADDLVRAWFIEIDLGTEHLPTLLAKCRDYESYRQTGIEQDRHGSFPLVLWSLAHTDPATAQRRRQALAQAIATDPRLPSTLFRIVAPDQLLPLIANGGRL